MKIMLDKYKNAILPTRAHPFDGGLDLYAPEASEVPGAVGLGGLVKDRFEVVCGKAIINTGVHVAIPEGCVGLVKSRSGLMTKHGITTDGTIDSGYTGPIKVCLLNHSSKRYYIERGERIAQLVILPCLLPELELVDSLEETDRGDNGFGSTGR